MCQEPIKLREVSLLPILMISDKFKWKGDDGLIKPSKGKWKISFIFFLPLYLSTQQPLIEH